MAESDRSAGESEVPEFLVVLGLSQPVTVDDVKQAYLEKAKTAHPDHGGDVQTFIRLQQAFEQATEYARFKAGRMKWLSGWVEQYAEQQQAIEQIKALGGSVEVESVDWMARTVGSDFATVLERVTTLRLDGPTVDDRTLLALIEHRRTLSGMHRLELTNTRVTGEGLAMLAAAGSPDTHPHRFSTAEDRRRWDRDVKNFNEDRKRVETFFRDVLNAGHNVLLSEFQHPTRLYVTAWLN